MNVLFVCNQNMLRSPTAAKIFAMYPNINVDSAGLNDTAVKVLKGEQLLWANIIFVMDKNQMNRLKKKFRTELGYKRVINLDIPDEYDYMDEALISLLKQKVSGYLVPR